MGAASAAGGYEIDQSCRFNDADSPELSRTYTLSSPWTFSAWVKRGERASENLILGASAGEIHFNSNDTLEAETTSSTAVFRDSSAWYHIHVSNGGLYVNGVSHGAVTTTTLTNTKLFDDFDGYVAEVHLQAGTSAYTNFGKINADGVWVPISATVGDTYLEFADSADFGVNSGTGGAWTAAGLTTNDQVPDSPTNNYATLDPNFPLKGGGALSEGNLVYTHAGLGTYPGYASTFWMTTGKWKFECQMIGWGAAGIGLTKQGTYGVTAFNKEWLANAGFPWISLIYYPYSDLLFVDGVNQYPTAATRSVSSVYTVLFDADAKKCWIDIDGIVPDGDPEAGTGGFAVTGDAWSFSVGTGSTSQGVTCNFGQYAFTETGYPSFNACSTANIPEPTIKDGSAHFQTTLYTGNGTAIGSGGNAISQSGNSTFQPDFAWIKGRSGATEHVLTDAVRGVTKELSSNDDGVEETVAEGLTTFGSAGFTVGSDGSYNTNSATYAAWQWKANGAGSSNEDGTINTTATSANTTAGCSVVTYVGNGTSGATVGHGLGVVPNMIIVKNRDQADAWQVYHSGNTAAPETDYLVLDTTAATADNVNRWNDTAPTSSVFSLGDAVEVNTNTENYVAYCFADVEGYSKFGSYVGDGTANGPFISTGFKPAYVLLKRSSTAGNDWFIWDTARNTYNVATTALSPNQTYTESGIGSQPIDLLSNGFKLRDSSANKNGSGSTYIYAAFAENPFGGENTSPATAR